MDLIYSDEADASIRKLPPVLASEVRIMCEKIADEPSLHTDKHAYGVRAFERRFHINEVPYVVRAYFDWQPGDEVVKITGIYAD